MKETWKAIPGFEGLYEASTYGAIKSLSRIKKGRYGEDRLYQDKILSKNRRPYCSVVFFVNGKRLQYFTHRLIALTFHPNPLNLPQVNHKDGNKLNNHVDNLEWVTPSANILHAYRTGLLKKIGQKREEASRWKGGVCDLPNTEYKRGFARARARGLDWSSMPQEQRILLINEPRPKYYRDKANELKKLKS